MKQFFIVILVALLLPFSSSRAGGNGVGNGGDSVECVSSPISPYAGFYSLDYLANVIAESSFAADFSKSVPAGSPFDTQIQRVMEATKKTSPTFSQALQTYHDSLFQNSSSAPYSWKRAPYGLNEINDESLNLNLPPNCLQNGHSKPYLQTVIRNPMQHQVQFTLFQTVYDKLDSLQKSFLLFHEWLWSFTQDPEVVRNANAVLHSEWNENNASNKLALLYLAGFDFNTIGMKTSEVRIGINDSGLVCDQVYGYCSPTRSTSFYEVASTWNAKAVVLRFQSQTSGKDTYLIRATTKENFANARFIKIPQNAEAILWTQKNEFRYCLLFADQGASDPIPDFSHGADVAQDVAICPKGTQITVVSSR